MPRVRGRARPGEASEAARPRRPPRTRTTAPPRRRPPRHRGRLVPRPRRPPRPPLRRPRRRPRHRGRHHRARHGTATGPLPFREQPTKRPNPDQDAGHPPLARRNADYTLRRPPGAGGGVRITNYSSIVTPIVTPAETADLGVQQLQEDPKGVVLVNVLGHEPAEFVAEFTSCHPRPVGMGLLGPGSPARLAHGDVFAAEPGPVASGPLGITQGVTISFHIVTVP
jgi:hypothetical protein